MRKENMSLFIGLAGLALIIGIVYYFATTPAPEEQTQTPVTVSPVISQNPVAAQDPGNMNPGYGDLTKEQIATADIAIGKLLNSSEGITPPMITVKSFEAKEFADASLGCPNPDKMYAQVITPGYQVILEAQGKTYDYRLTDEKNIILCEQ
jgi:hypothetical protein